MEKMDATLTKEMTTTLHRAIITLGTYTAHRFDVWMLSGTANASCRAHVMADLLGVEKIAQARAGVTALRAEFYQQAGIVADCERNMQIEFINFCERAGK